MKKCKKCGDEFPSSIKIGEKRIDSRRRVYCLKCNPFKERNCWNGKYTQKSLGIDRGRSQKHICPTCGREHSNQTRNLECYNCKNKKVRFERKSKAYELKGNKCFICGYNKCKDALALHHIDPNEKKFTFSMSWGLAWEEIEKELKKCILLCCRCHAEVHNGMTKIERA